MNAKKLEPDSDYADYDTDGDGVVSDEELETSKELQSLRLQFERANAQKTMAWFSLVGHVAVSQSSRLFSVDRTGASSRNPGRYGVCVFCFGSRYFSGILWRTGLVKQE